MKSQSRGQFVKYISQAVSIPKHLTIELLSRSEKCKTEWKQMDEWYLFNILNIELSGTGVSSDVIWNKRQNILALCHLFINIIKFTLFEKLF